MIAGDRDPLVRVDRVHVFAALPQVDAVRVPGAHALNFSSPELMAELIDAHLAGQPLTSSSGPLRAVTTLEVKPEGPLSGPR